MDTNIYALERQVESKLAEARAASARAALVASVRGGGPDVLAAVGLALIRIGRCLARRRGGRRHAAGVALPGLP
jgi:hypothetical protein